MNSLFKGSFLALALSAASVDARAYESMPVRDFLTSPVLAQSIDLLNLPVMQFFYDKFVYRNALGTLPTIAEKTALVWFNQFAFEGGPGLHEHFEVLTSQEMAGTLAYNFMQELDQMTNKIINEDWDALALRVTTRKQAANNVALDGMFTHKTLKTMLVKFVQHARSVGLMENLLVSIVQFNQCLQNALLTKAKSPEVQWLLRRFLRSAQVDQAYLGLAALKKVLGVKGVKEELKQEQEIQLVPVIPVVVVAVTEEPAQALSAPVSETVAAPMPNKVKPAVEPVQAVTLPAPAPAAKEGKAVEPVETVPAPAPVAEIVVPQQGVPVEEAVVKA